MLYSKGDRVRCLTDKFGAVMTKNGTYIIQEDGPDIFDQVYVIDNLNHLNSFNTMHFEKLLSSFVCECGSDITYGPHTEFHSFWCPKFPKRD